MLSAMISRLWRENRMPEMISRNNRGRSFVVSTFAAHCDGIRDANGVVLPCQHSLLQHGFLDSFAEIQYWTSMLDFLICDIPGRSRVYPTPSYGSLTVHTRRRISNPASSSIFYRHTCMDFLPTTQRPRRRGGCFSSHLDLARLRHTT